MGNESPALLKERGGALSRLQITGRGSDFFDGGILCSA